MDASATVVTETLIEDWCRRLDELSDRRESIDVEDLHECLKVALGRHDARPPQPLDLRIHRRLGQLYLDTRTFELAVGEYELALRLAPRDIMLLRALGQARLERSDDISQILETIKQLDPRAFERNIDCAALKGRFERQRENFDEARRVYEAAAHCHPRNYYVRELLGRVQLAQGDHEGARESFTAALYRARAAQQTVWAHATAATSLLALGSVDDALVEVRALVSLGPTERQRVTLRKGFEELRVLMRRSSAELAPLLDALDGRRPAR